MKKYSVPKRGEKIDWQVVTLLTIKSTSVLAVALVAPNALRMFKLFEKKKTKTQNLTRAVKKVEQRGLIARDANGRFYLTKTGENELHNFEFQTRTKHRRWDKKWRVVMFDIEEKKRGVRNRVREYLQNAGFFLVQKSVWIYPFPCNNIIELLKNEFGLEDEMLYMVVEALNSEVEKDLKMRFQLR